MAHPLARRSRLAADEGHHRFIHVLADPLGGFFLGRAPDLTDQDDRQGVRIRLELLEYIDEIGPVDRVSADPDRRRLPDAAGGQLMNRLIGEGPAAGDDPHLSGHVDVSGHDADLALARRDHSRAVGADQTGFLPFHVPLHLDHVEDGYALGDADHQIQVRIHRFHDRISGKGRGNVDDRRVGSRLFDRLLNGVKNRDALDGGSALARSYPRNHFRSVVQRLLGVKHPVGSGDSLRNHFGVLVHEYAQRPTRLSSTCSVFISPGKRSFAPRPPWNRRR